MNVLITGGAGFIGQHVTKRLMELGHQTVVYDSFERQAHKGTQGGYPGHKIFAGDVRDGSRLTKVIIDNDIHCIVHLAAQVGAGQSMYQIKKYTDHNVNGTATLMEVLANDKHNVQRVVLASSRAVYGEGPYHCSACREIRYPWPRTPRQLEDKIWNLYCGKCGQCLDLLRMQEEESTLYPTSIYGQNKLAQENLLRVTANAYGLEWNILRLFNVYGPGQSVNNPYTGIVSIMMNWALSNKPMIVYEDGWMIKDFVFVDDVARAFALAINAPVSGVFNVGTGVATSMWDLTNIIGTVAVGVINKVISEQYRVGDARSGYANTAKAAKFLDFTAETRLRIGIEKLYAWAKEQPLSHVAEDSKLVAKGLSR